jgi:predicted anti-sigma-YlaC factor YlaD
VTDDEWMTCKELVELVTAYLEDVLDAETRARFDHHLTKCDGCRNYLEQFRVTVRTVGKIRDDELDPAFRSRLLDAFKDFR